MILLGTFLRIARSIFAPVANWLYGGTPMVSSSLTSPSLSHWPIGQKPGAPSPVAPGPTLVSQSSTKKISAH